MTSSHKSNSTNKREAPKSFWSKFDQSKLTEGYPELPQILLELFPAKTLPELFRLWKEFHGDVNAVVRECLHDPTTIYFPTSSHFHPSNHENTTHDSLSPNWFSYVAEDVLDRTFQLLELEDLGHLTLVNRECRHVAKRCFARVKEYDFTTFYEQRHFRMNEMVLASFMNSMPSLQHFALRNADFTNYRHIAGIVSSQRILSLNLSGCRHLTSVAVRDIIVNFVRLKHLDVSATQIDDQALEYISEHAETEDLETLVINRCPNVTDYGIKNILLSDRFHLKNYFFRETQYTGFSWNDLTVHLEYIDFRGCDQLTDFVLDATSFQSSTLSISANTCNHLRNVSIIAPQLREFHALGCTRLQRLQIQSKTLEILGLTQCDRLENIDVPSSTLQVIQLSGCKSLQLEDFGRPDNFVFASLAAGNLRSLDLRNMIQLQDFLVEPIIIIKTKTKKGRCLEHLSVAGCKILSPEIVDDVTRHFRPVKRSKRRVTPLRRLKRTIH